MSARAGALLALLVLGLGAGCASDDDLEHAALHGTVRDSMTGARLKGVQVEFVADTLERGDDTTDDEGRYAIDVAAMALSGRLTASKSGYAPTTVSVFLDDDDVSVDIELERE